MSSGTAGPVAEAVLSIWHSYRFFILASITLVVVAIRQYQKQQKPLESKHQVEPAVAQPPKVAPKVEPTPSIERVLPTATNPPASNTTVPVKAGSGSKPQKNVPKRVVGNKPLKKAGRRNNGNDSDHGIKAIQPLVFFSSLTGTTEKKAESVCERLKENANQDAQCKLLEPQLHDISTIDFDDYFISPPKASEAGTAFFYCIVVPTYDIDTILDTFLAHLDETHYDFRIDTSSLSTLVGYAVFGLGDRQGWPTEAEGFCSQAKEVDRWMAKLTGKRRAYPLGMGDVKTNGDAALQEWSNGLSEVLNDMLANGGSLGEGVPGSGDPLESDEEDIDDDSDGSSNGGKKKKNSDDIADLEDIKPAIDSDSTSKPTGDLPIDFTTYSKSKPNPAPVKEMVPKTSPTYAALTKQGYTIVGSHSGVKICRWTKSALRGRGSCYKYSFYGINSHLCMESTPSLSCSNKCVFCWRHGTNPVGTTWRWQVDPPDQIFNGVKEGHYKKIKMLRGVPGVRAERFAEAMRIRHCALSLVGEPIFYPHINELVDLLHSEQISTFLVCNAQHPDQLASLHRITQLYVSIDASNRESLRKIDRPLHRDFWERFQRCLSIIREKRNAQRTVYRFTLVKGFNVEDEVMGYADLVEKGIPCFVEIKGVTYCGTSTSAGAGLTMKNVPFYEEVVEFAESLNTELNRRGLGYGLAAEHSHSCCILLASNRFHVDGKWHTRINYERFFSLLAEEKKNGTPFTPEDYMRETEEWALWGNGGFDPRDERVYTRGKNKKKNAIAAAAAATVTEVTEPTGTT